MPQIQIAPNSFGFKRDSAAAFLETASIRSNQRDSSLCQLPVEAIGVNSHPGVDRGVAAHGGFSRPSPRAQVALKGKTNKQTLFFSFSGRFVLFRLVCDAQKRRHEEHSRTVLLLRLTPPVAAASHATAAQHTHDRTAHYAASNEQRGQHEQPLGDTVALCSPGRAAVVSALARVPSSSRAAAARWLVRRPR